MTIASGRVRVTVNGLGTGAGRERGLADEITTAWQTALRREHDARQRLRTEIRGEATRRPVPEIVARLEKRRAAREAIDVGAFSPGRAVWAQRIGSTRARIKIRPETLTNMDESALEREVDAAIEAVDRARAEARSEMSP